MPVSARLILLMASASPPNTVRGLAKSSKPRHYHSTPSAQDRDAPLESGPRVDEASRHAPSKDMSRASRPRRQSPYPFNRDAILRMKILASNVKSAAQKAQRQPADTEDKSSRTARIQVTVPQSPFVAQVKKLNHASLPKREPTFKELEPLKNNQWAQMLAKPIRACQGSGARLPTPFLTDLGYVTKPGEEKVYLMPDQLADLEGLEKQMAKELYEEDWRRVRDDKKAARERCASGQVEEPTTTAIEHTNSISDHLRILPQSRVFSDINFMRFMTLKFTRLIKRSPPTIKTRVAEVATLIPNKAKEAINLAQHYMHHHRGVDFALGLEPEEPEVKVQDRYLRHIQWQHDIHDRVARIMQKRILVVIKALAEQAKDDVTNGGSTKVVALPFPKSGGFDTENKEQNADAAGHRDIPSGSVFLHIGDKDTSALLSSTKPAAPTSISPTLPSNPIIPPMLGVDDTHRIPVFPLSQMLASTTDTTDLEALQGLTSQYSSIRLPDNKRSGVEDYLLLVRPGVGPPKALVQEIWQLWRYLGGSRMGLIPDADDEGRFGSKNARDDDDAEDVSEEVGNNDDEPAGRPRWRG
ncbi:hypothetical protein LTS07_002101 [Exophiala sideris]|uniref:Uncharacterized protein n=1 Tax=Exophiala sideris TaxID=1016849 RepID=A0ABR0JLG9_9EURO|nr:hypothetical protein LTS07_002101 [Exophiala sideris]KAK5066758.1 hypothetical protein LTR69_002105 [Exophiala sideris]KAK5184816.1 hypothetical protein LTR44_002662 [Eurotiomycetes sp. CCFEE 6388]